MNPTLQPDLIADLRELLQFPFMVSALEAGTIVAVLAAVAGWYVVLRRSAFTSHTLSVMAFPGAAGASLLGLPVSLGYYAACTMAALALVGPGARRHASTGSRGSGSSRSGGETAVVGTVQTVGLAAGFLFLSLNQAVLGSPDALLFGTFLGITQGQVLALLVIAALVIGTLAVIGRPLLFATVDREAAQAGGVPVARLDALFLVILALAIAATSQLTGALLVFALLVAPAACAQLITAQPVAGLALSIAFALGIVWLGLALAYFSVYPVGFYVTTIAFALYAGLRLRVWARRRR
ncbi:MAG: metal ABC transporter permease [Solirubrobacteraceae bacterium]